MFHKLKKKGRIYGFRSIAHGKGARFRQRNDRPHRAFHHTEERRPHTNAPEPKTRCLPRWDERPFGSYSEKIRRSGADTQNRKQPSTGYPHQRIGNARGHEADRRRGAFGRVVRRQSEILRRHIRKGEHRGGSPAQGRGNAAHTRYARPHRQGRAKAQETGGADEEAIPQEADRHREAVRRRYYDTAEIEVLPRYLCRSDGEIRAAKGHRRLESSPQVHAAVLSGYTETRRQSQSGSGGFATAERNGTGGTKTGEKRDTDREAERGGNHRSRQHRRECRFSFREQQGQDAGKGEHCPAQGGSRPRGNHRSPARQNTDHAGRPQPGDTGNAAKARQGDSGQGHKAQAGNIVSENGNRKGGGMVSLFP